MDNNKMLEVVISVTVKTYSDGYDGPRGNHVTSFVAIDERELREFMSTYAINTMMVANHLYALDVDKKKSNETE